MMITKGVKSNFVQKITSVLIAILLLGVAESFASEPISLSVGIYDPSSAVPGHGKMPLRIPTIILDDSQVYFHDAHPDYTLTLLNEDGDVVYSTIVPAGTSTVTLPATLTGDYELRLYPDGTAYFFYGWIEL